MDEYNVIKKYMSLFAKQDYFNLYTSADLFLNYFNDDNRYLFSFLNNFLEDCVGIQLFDNNNGFNYVNDVLSLSVDNMLIAGRIDSICAIYLDKDLLTDEDIDFIHKMGHRVKKDKNLVIYRYELGKMKRFANKKEMIKLIKNCEFVYSLVKDNYKDTIEAFNDAKSPISFIDEKLLVYRTMYSDLPNLSISPRRMPINKQVVEEFKEFTYTGEECYMFVAYTPLIIKETGVRPLLVYFYFSERNKVVFKYITDEPKEYKNYIFGILDDVFSKEGLPEKVYLNDRSFYSFLNKTLKELNIDTELLLEENKIDLTLLNAVERLYQNSEELYTETKDGIEMVLDLIINELNMVAEIMEREAEEEGEKEKIVV